MKASRLWLAAFMISIYFTGIQAQYLTDREAREWCDKNATEAIEGIWEYPEDNTRVLIRRDRFSSGEYSITVISTPDCRLVPGDVIGRLHVSADPRKFKLEQSTKKEGAFLLKPSDCLATLSADGESIKVKSTKLKFRISPTTLLPKFWRMVRISISTPTDEIPSGMIKIYPGYDHNASMRRKIRIL